MDSTKGTAIDRVVLTSPDIFATVLDTESVGDLNLARFMRVWHKFAQAVSLVANPRDPDMVTIVRDTLAISNTLESVVDSMSLEKVAVQNIVAIIQNASALLTRAREASKRYDNMKMRKDTIREPEEACKSRIISINRCFGFLGAKVAKEFTYLEDLSKVNRSNDCKSLEVVTVPKCEGTSVRAYFAPNAPLNRRHVDAAKMVTSAMLVVVSLLLESNACVETLTEDTILVCPNGSVKLVDIDKKVSTDKDAEDVYAESLAKVCNVLELMSDYLAKQTDAKCRRTSERLLHLATYIQHTSTLPLIGAGMVNFYFGLGNGPRTLFRTVCGRARDHVQNMMFKRATAKTAQKLVSTIDSDPPNRHLVRDSVNSMDKSDRAQNQTRSEAVGPHAEWRSFLQDGEDESRISDRISTLRPSTAVDTRERSGRASMAPQPDEESVYGTPRLSRNSVGRQSSVRVSQSADTDQWAPLDDDDDDGVDESKAVPAPQEGFVGRVVRNMLPSADIDAARRTWTRPENAQSGRRALRRATSADAQRVSEDPFGFLR